MYITSVLILILLLKYKIDVNIVKLQTMKQDLVEEDTAEVLKKRIPHVE